MGDRAVAWTDAARRDLDAIIDYIAEQHPRNALQVFDRLQHRAVTLQAQAARGRGVPELRGLGAIEYRELIERPWRIIYRTEPGRVVVVALLDGRRDLPTLLFERLVRP